MGQCSRKLVVEGLCTIWSICCLKEGLSSKVIPNISNARVRDEVSRMMKALDEMTDESFLQW